MLHPSSNTVALAARGPLQTGPKGGQYYVGPSGRKIYVKPGSKAREPAKAKKAAPRAPRKTPAQEAKAKARAEAKAARDSARAQARETKARAKAARDEAREKARAAKAKEKADRAAARDARAKAKASHAETKAKAKAARDEARAKAKAAREKARAEAKAKKAKPPAKDPAKMRGEIKGGDAKTRAETDRVLDKLGAEKMPLKRLEHRESLQGVGNNDDPRAVGLYMPGRLSAKGGEAAIFMRDLGARNHEILADTPLGSDLVTGGVSHLETVITHEYGHHVHLGGDGNSLTSQTIDGAVYADYVRADRNPVSKYGSANHKEHFAESYTAYKLKPEALKTHDPKTFAMVQRVLRLRRIEE